MKFYVIGDTIALFYFKDIIKMRKVYQLSLHHFVTLTLLIVQDYSNKENDLNSLIHDIINIETSTFLIVLTRQLKLPKFFNYFSMFVWIYYRVIYFPCLVYTTKWKWIYPQFYLPELICLGCLEIIKNLGFVWTLEVMRVPRIYYRPLVVSITSCLIPLINVSNKLFTFNIFYLLCNSVLHHSHWNKNDFIQRCDKLAVFITALHGFSLFYDHNLFLISLFMGVFLFSIARKLNQDPNLRDWDSLPGLLPHVFTHIILSIGVYYSFLK
jgi:hypothetical protein